MKINKIYRKKQTILKHNKYLITNKVRNGLKKVNNAITKKSTNTITEPTFKGGSFLKILITDHENELIKILTKNDINIVYICYGEKWYLGNYIKDANLVKQNITILYLLLKRKNKIT